MQLDVTSQRSIQNTANKIKAKFNGLDILINNAAYKYSLAKVGKFDMSYIPFHTYILCSSSV